MDTQSLDSRPFADRNLYPTTFFSSVNAKRNRKVRVFLEWVRRNGGKQRHLSS